MLSVGLMSGTSMDGIDAALLETNGARQVKSIDSVSMSYQIEFIILLKSAEYAIRKANGNLEHAKKNYQTFLTDYLLEELRIDKLDLSAKKISLANYLALKRAPKLIDIVNHSTELHITAVRKLLEKTSCTTNQIDLIGYHGQTLWHQPDLKLSISIGDAAYMANKLGIIVINNFRTADIEAGGQGAPFAPIYHQALAVRDNLVPLAVVNCGGISNITIINSKMDGDLIGFDTGPGNALIDSLIRQRTQGAENMDRDGVYGKQGVVNDDVLNALYKKSTTKNTQNYFELKPPKSLDYNELRLIPELEKLNTKDACATLEAFTAKTIVDSVAALTIQPPKRWVLAGGGWHNPMIYSEFKDRLTQLLGSHVEIFKADEVSWHDNALEAEIFAYLAVRSLLNKPLSFPGTTGVEAPVLGGQIHKPNQVLA